MLMSMAMDWAYVDVMVRCPHALGHIVYLDFKKKKKEGEKKQQQQEKKTNQAQLGGLHF